MRNMKESKRDKQPNSNNVRKIKQNINLRLQTTEKSSFYSSIEYMNQTIRKEQIGRPAMLYVTLHGCMNINNSNKATIISLLSCTKTTQQINLMMAIGTTSCVCLLAAHFLHVELFRTRKLNVKLWKFKYKTKEIDQHETFMNEHLKIVFSLVK